MVWIPKFIAQRNAPSFQAKTAKAEVIRVRAQGGGTKEAKRTAPPVPDTPAMQRQRAAHEHYQAQLTSRNNWGGFEWETRHEGTGVNFALYGGDVSRPAMGGTQYHQQDQTEQRRYQGPPDTGAGYGQRSVNVGQPPVEQLPYTPRPLHQRIAGWFTQPEPRPIIDLRQSGGPLMDPNQYQERAVTSWPGEPNHPPERTPWPGEGDPRR